MLHRTLLTAASVIALTASANAADLYRGAPAAGGYKDTPNIGVTWTGFYFGANGGYGWSNKEDPIKPDGGFGGGQIGYNIQQGNIVFGVESDFEGADITKDGIVSGRNVTAKMDWFGTVRGRLGYAYDRALIYGTGGFAYGEIDNTGYDKKTKSRLGGRRRYRVQVQSILGG